MWWVGVGVVSQDIEIDRVGRETTLGWNKRAFYRTEARVDRLRTIRIGSSMVFLWEETDRSGINKPRYAVSLDGQTIDRVATSQERLSLRYGEIEPLTPPRNLPTGWKAAPSNEMYIVQFHGQPLDAFTEAVAQAGGTVFNFLPETAYVCRLPGEAVKAVRALPLVRAVARFEPAYRIDPHLLSAWRSGSLDTKKYIIQTCGDDPALKRHAAFAIGLVGGRIEDCPPEGTLMIVELTPAQLPLAVACNGVLWVDEWSTPGVDMSNVRTVNGGLFLENNTPYRGQGVNAHVIDTGVRATHDAIDTRLTVRNNSGDTSHGTSTSGIVTGNGAGTSSGTGMLPLGNLAFTVMVSNWSTASRLAWTQNTVNTYNCVLESNSWGDTLTGQYTTISSSLDEIIFKTDLLICNSMSNWGNNQQVRPQAWAKNIVAVGAVNHFNNANTADDRWQGTGSIGPAADGRIKPELCFWYDSIQCPSNSSDTSYTTGFGGTSAATPIVAGCFGLFFQMWGDGAFFNSNLGSSVFANRCKSTTAKAFLINTANPYNNNGALPFADITRYVQGWGLPNVQNIFDRREAMFVDNESTVLTNLQTARYQMIVLAGTPELRATMAYMDPWAAPNSNPTRINDLNLKVIAPNGAIYHGNNGATSSIWTAPGGAPDGKNTVENVFVKAPTPGIWTIEVNCALLAQDARTETNGVNDVDFALVVSGVKAHVAADSMSAINGNVTGGVAADLGTSNNKKVEMVSTSGGVGSPETTLEVTSKPFPNMPVKAKLRVESSSADADVILQVEALNHKTDQWIVIGNGQPINGADSVRVIELGSTAGLLDGNRVMTVRCRWKREATGAEITSGCDQIVWDLTPIKPNLGSPQP
ncbi:MAG: hypothetical protein HONBIEJF_02692 [Fimbriimonadaceae bacterium]|nr:hypothetical protein [Fimbriimonadaceae bacterium]